MLYIDQLVQDMQQRGITIGVIDGRGRKRPSKYPKRCDSKHKDQGKRKIIK